MKRNFFLPQEPAAWWAFASAELAGLLAVSLVAPHRLFEAVLLGLAFACLFCASDWISSLHGKGYGGDVEQGRFGSPLGLGLLATALGSLACFFRLQPAADSHFWALALLGTSALTVVMFVMRLEWVAVDTRLVLLASLLCTVPVLLIGFLAWGPGEGAAWKFWMAPALFFPVSSLFAQAWLRGLYGGAPPLVTLSVPLLGLCLAAVAAGSVVSALLSAFYLAYMLRRLLARFRDGGGHLPSFAVIRRFGIEQAAWNAAFVATWLSHRFLFGVHS